MPDALWRFAASALENVVVARKRASRLSILIFHGVSERPEVIGHCDVDRQRFEKLVELVTKAFTVLPLGEAVKRLHDGTLPERALSITFDDGYANNHEVALPILERAGARATFFVATDFLDGGWMFNDIVIDSVRRCESPELDLSCLGLRRYDLATTELRRLAIGEIIGALKYLKVGEREDQAERVRQASGVSASTSLMMTSEQVQDLARRGMEVGGHTLSHPILNSASDEDARREIHAGKLRLEEIIGGAIQMFAYPNGQPGVDYSSRHVAMVREAGFEAAVSTAHACATENHDRFQLPRFTPWDLTPGRFMCRLAVTRAWASEAGQA